MGKLVVLMVTAFVDMVGLIIVFPILPFYARDLGASGTMVGLLVSAFSVAQLVSAPVWGRLSDRYGRRPALLTGLWVSAVGYVVFAYSGSLAVLFLSRIVQGLGGGTVGVVQAYVADASDPRDRAKTLGWLSAATSAGAVVGGGLGSLLMHLWGRMAPGLVSAALCVTVSVFAWLYLREARELRQSASGAFPVAHRPRSGLAALARVVTRSAEPAPRLIWIYTIAIGAFYGTTPVLPLLLADRLRVTAETVGYFVGYLGGMGFVIRSLILGRMVDRLGEARLCRLGLVLLAAGLGLVSVAYSYPTLWIALTLMPLGTAFIFPCVTALLSRVVPGAQRGLYMGVQQTFGGLSRVAFPLAAGFAIDRFGSGMPFWMSGLLVMATLLLTTSMEDYMQPAPNPAIP